MDTQFANNKYRFPLTGSGTQVPKNQHFVNLWEWCIDNEGEARSIGVVKDWAITLAG